MYLEKELPFKVGESYLIRTVTHYWVGRVIEITGSFIKMDPAAWVADTGRFHKAVDVGHLAEVEVISVPAFINCEAIVDAIEWHTALPTDSK